MDFPTTERVPYNHSNPLVRFYFYGILKKAVKLAGLTENKTILDFGCGEKKLKFFLSKKINYIGFDIAPEHTEIKDYKETRPELVFALNVFEHLTKEELEQAINNFFNMNVKNIITSQPTEHFLAKWLSKKTGYYEINKAEHKQNWQQVHSIISKYYILRKQTDFYTMQKISLWDKKYA